MEVRDPINIKFKPGLFNGDYFRNILSTFIPFVRKFEVKFEKIACDSIHSIALTQDNIIKVWGGNLYGQIGNGLKSEWVKKQDINIISRKMEQKMVNMNIDSFVYSCSAILFVIVNCVLFINNPSEPILQILIDSFVFLLGFFSAIIVCILINIIANKRRSQISQNNIREDNKTKVKQLVCGAHHNFVLFENGNLWGWGSNNHGQLGLRALGEILCPTLIYTKVERVATSNNHSIVLCNEGTANDPSRFIYAMGDNTFAQLGNFNNIRYNEPLKFATNYTGIATMNNISLGKRENDDNEIIIEAWGLLTMQDNERNNPRRKKKFAKIITKPTQVKCKSFNEFIERNFSLTYFWVNACESPSLSRNPNDPPEDLIDQFYDNSQIEQVNYYSDSGEPVNEDRVINVHIGPKNYNSLMSGCSVRSGALVNVEDFTQIGNYEDKTTVSSVFSRLTKSLTDIFTT